MVKQQTVQICKECNKSISKFALKNDKHRFICNKDFEKVIRQGKAPTYRCKNCLVNTKDFKKHRLICKHTNSIKQVRIQTALTGIQSKKSQISQIDLILQNQVEQPQHIQIQPTQLLQQVVQIKDSDDYNSDNQSLKWINRHKWIIRHMAQLFVILSTPLLQNKTKPNHLISQYKQFQLKQHWDQYQQYYFDNKFPKQLQLQQYQKHITEYDIMFIFQNERVESRFLQSCRQNKLKIKQIHANQIQKTTTKLIHYEQIVVQIQRGIDKIKINQAIHINIYMAIIRLFTKSAVVDVNKVYNVRTTSSKIFFSFQTLQKHFVSYRNYQQQILIQAIQKCPFIQKASLQYLVTQQGNLVQTRFMIRNFSNFILWFRQKVYGKNFNIQRLITPSNPIFSLRKRLSVKNPQTKSLRKRLYNNTYYLKRAKNYQTYKKKLKSIKGYEKFENFSFLCKIQDKLKNTKSQIRIKTQIQFNKVMRKIIDAYTCDQLFQYYKLVEVYQFNKQSSQWFRQIKFSDAQIIKLSLSTIYKNRKFAFQLFKEHIYNSEFARSIWIHQFQNQLQFANFVAKYAAQNDFLIHQQCDYDDTLSKLSKNFKIIKNQSKYLIKQCGWCNNIIQYNVKYMQCRNCLLIYHHTTQCHPSIFCRGCLQKNPTKIFQQPSFSSYKIHKQFINPPKFTFTKYQNISWQYIKNDFIQYLFVQYNIDHNKIKYVQRKNIMFQNIPMTQYTKIEQISQQDQAILFKYQKSQYTMPIYSQNGVLHSSRQIFQNQFICWMSGAIINQSTAHLNNLHVNSILFNKGSNSLNSYYIAPYQNIWSFGFLLKQTNNPDKVNVYKKQILVYKQGAFRKQILCLSSKYINKSDILYVLKQQQQIINSTDYQPQYTYDYLQYIKQSKLNEKCDQIDYLQKLKKIPKQQINQQQINQQQQANNNKNDIHTRTMFIFNPPRWNIKPKSTKKQDKQDKQFDIIQKQQSLSKQIDFISLKQQKNMGQYRSSVGLDTIQLMIADKKYQDPAYKHFKFNRNIQIQSKQNADMNINNLFDEKKIIGQCNLKYI